MADDSKIVSYILRFEDCDALERALGLGHPFSQTVEEAKQKYRQLALMVHPDRNSDALAGEAFQFVKSAFDQVLAKFESREREKPTSYYDDYSSSSESSSSTEDEHAPAHYPAPQAPIMPLTFNSTLPIRHSPPPPSISSSYVTPELLSATESNSTTPVSSNIHSQSSELDPPTPFYEFRCPHCKTKLRLSLDKITSDIINCLRCHAPVSWRAEVDSLRKKNAGYYASERLYFTGMKRRMERNREFTEYEKERTAAEMSPLAPTPVEKPRKNSSPHLPKQKEMCSPTAESRPVWQRLHEISQKKRNSPTLPKSVSVDNVTRNTDHVDKTTTKSRSKVVKKGSSPSHNSQLATTAAAGGANKKPEIPHSQSFPSALSNSPRSSPRSPRALPATGASMPAIPMQPPAIQQCTELAFEIPPSSPLGAHTPPRTNSFHEWVPMSPGELEELMREPQRPPIAMLGDQRQMPRTDVKQFPTNAFPGFEKQFSLAMNDGALRGLPVSTPYFFYGTSLPTPRRTSSTPNADLYNTHTHGGHVFPSSMQPQYVQKAPAPPVYAPQYGFGSQW